MQLQHECKDSSQSLRKKRNRTMDNERRAARNSENEESDMAEIMDHIDSVENYYSRANAESRCRDVVGLGPIRWFICVHKSDVGQTRLVDILRVRE